MTPGDRTQFVWMQNGEPPGLYCADESDGEALRVCEQMTEALYAYETAGTAAIPALAEFCEPNTELTDVDLHAPPGRDVPRRRDARRERRRPDLRRPVGCRASAAQGPRQLVHLLPGPVRWVPEPAAAGSGQLGPTRHDLRRASPPAAPFAHPSDRPVHRSPYRRGATPPG